MKKVIARAGFGLTRHAKQLVVTSASICLLSDLTLPFVLVGDFDFDADGFLSIDRISHRLILELRLSMFCAGASDGSLALEYVAIEVIALLPGS